MRLRDGPPALRVVGRDREVSEIRQMLESSPGVVTVTGRGGVGKTSVASEVVRDLGALDERVWVPLAGVTDPDLVLPEVAQALGAPIEAGSDVAGVVADVLGHGRRVLALDNAEHLLGFAPTLAALLERCPDLRVLVTSRAPLRLRAERVVTLAPLPDPTDPADTTLDELAEQPAVAIYCRRAAAVDRGFELTDQNAPAIVELCRRLEGLPLAIELAAARAAMLPAPEMLRRLEGSALDVLHRPRGDAPERHHGLRATIDWTYRLLEPHEQRALRHVSVNVGSFDLDAAVALIAPADGGEPATAQALDALSSLVDFHLVDPLPGADPPRFTIPDSIRAFALEELDRCGEADEVGRRRIRVRARQARTVADGSESCTSEGSMEDDRDDLLDALRSAIELGLADDALDLVRGLGSHWDLRGYGPVQEQLVERALELGERAGADPSRLANATLWSAYLGLRHSSTRDHDELVERIRAAEDLARSAGDDRAVFHAQNVWLLVTPTTGDVGRAVAAVEEGLRLADANHHDGWRATIQVWAGMLAQLTGDERRAAELGMAALDEARRRGDRETVVRAYMLLGPLADRLPDQVTGLPSVEEMIELTRALGLTFYEALLLLRRVYQGVRSGDPHGAEWLAESLDMARTMLGSPIVRFDLLVLVQLAGALGDLDRAAYFSGSLRDSLPTVEVYLHESQLGEYQEVLAEARDRLGAATFEQRVEQGARLTIGEAVDEAIRYVDGLRRPAREEGSPQPATPSGPLPTDRLTSRQKEVLQLLAEGLSNKEIAAKLGLRAKTVMHHTTAIYRELGVRGRSEATAVAFRAGLVE